MHKLIVVVLASSAFGGAVGALATAATQSEASPAAIAAAVQRVQDQSADASLRGINSKLGTVASRLSTVTNDLSPANGQLAGVAQQLVRLNTAVANAYTILTTRIPANVLQADGDNLYGLCLGDAGPDTFRCSVP